MEFNVGDRIVVKFGTSQNSKRYNGHEGFIISPDKNLDDKIFFRLRLDNGSREINVWPHEITLLAFQDNDFEYV